MAESAAQITFTHKELAEIMVRHQNLHEGFWGVYVEFSFGAANIGGGPDDILPAAIIPVVKVGIQRFPEINAISVDAAKVNPPKKTSSTPSTKKGPF